MFKLRDYQNKVVSAIKDAWELLRIVLAVVPTGGGKTVIFCALMQMHRGNCAAVVHRKEIVRQISCSLANLGVKHRIIAPPNVIASIRKRHLKLYGKSFIDPNAQAGVISVQTLTSKKAAKDKMLQRWVKQITLCVFDEGHHYVKKGIWGRAVEMMQLAKVLLVTATPERADGLGLHADADGFVEGLIMGPTTGWLMLQGYLADYIYKAPDSDLDVTDIPITANGDVNTKRLRERIVKSHLVGDVVDHYFKFAQGKRTIVFANDVKTAHEHERAFQDRGVKAVTVHGETDDKIRDRLLEQFEDGTGADVLINVDLFDEGFDVAGVEAVIMARVTESLAKFLQMIGRALRPVYAKGFDLNTQEGRLAAMAAGSKPKAIIIDAVSNWERHGMPDLPRAWNLQSRDKRSRKVSDLEPQRLCNECTQPYLAYYTQCPHCGAYPSIPERASPRQVDGDLTELDIEAMRELFAAQAKADMDDAEYKLDQIARNIPRIGRAADLRRHRAAKQRREVLRNLVGWWVGCQPEGREMAEIYKRFYFRFGVDMATAFTLKEKKTDALIQSITQQFGKDMAA